jgi:hypothetical protein
MLLFKHPQNRPFFIKNGKRDPYTYYNMLPPDYVASAGARNVYRNLKIVLPKHTHKHV